MNQERSLERIIEMAWEDRTPFEAIQVQFGLRENDVKGIMRKHQRKSSYIRWRKRVESGTSSKHLQKRSSKMQRFKSSRQRMITRNKISKRH